MKVSGTLLFFPLFYMSCSSVCTLLTKFSQLVWSSTRCRSFSGTISNMCCKTGIIQKFESVLLKFNFGYSSFIFFQMASNHKIHKNLKPLKFNTLMVCHWNPSLKETRLRTIKSFICRAKLL